MTAKGKGAGTYYISNIYVAKNMPNSALDITINGEERENASVKAGDTISLGTSNPEQYPYIEMTVTAPNGQEIVDLKNITAVAGTYTVTFKHNTIGTDKNDIGYYFLRHDYGGCYSRGGATKTLTFTVS